MTSIDLSAPVLYYQNPANALQSYSKSGKYATEASPTYSCRNCNANLAGSDPASQYQRQKIIQKTVRVYASLYADNLAPLNAYEPALNVPQIVEQAGTPYIVPAGVNWNQMSDRAVPSVQRTVVASGSAYHTSSTKHTITRNRPGALSPGGVGVDIKHNSYARYLNRIKGQAPLRRGVIPPNYGAPIPFTLAYPIYGGKTIKTSIVNNCNCPTNNSQTGNDIIYQSKANAIQDQILSVTYKFNIGDLVWALKHPTDTSFKKGEIIDISSDKQKYTVKFFDDGSIKKVPGYSILIYFDCNCQADGSLEEQALSIQYNGIGNEYLNSTGTLLCSILASEAASEVF